VLAKPRLKRPADGFMASGGRQGKHSEHLGFLLAEMQYLQRAYPGATLVTARSKVTHRPTLIEHP
jgi:ring-1,2-phenylacetyl-CoA epoxidase subunit PaaC